MFAKSSAYSVLNVELVLQNDTVHIQFLEEDVILGAAISARILSNDHDLDINADILINGNPLNIPKSKQFRLDPIGVFNLIFHEASQIPEFIEITIKFTKHSTFEYNKLGAYFIIDGDHEDSYYFEHELNRRVRS